MLRQFPPSTIINLLNSSSLQTAGNGGNSGDASGGEGSDVKITNEHQTQGGAGGSNSNGQATDCYGSCVTYVTQSSQGGNGGAATDSSNVQLNGNIGNTDSSGGNSAGGNGGNVRSPLLLSPLCSMMVSVFLTRLLEIE